MDDDDFSPQSALDGSKSAQTSLKLRSKINELLTIEAENKYISRNNEAQVAFSTSVGYLKGEVGRQFTRSPSAEFQKQTLLNIVSRRSYRPSSKLHTERVDPRVVQIMDVLSPHQTIRKEFTEKQIVAEIGTLLQDYASDKDVAGLLTGGLTRLHALQTGDGLDEDPATLYDLLGYQGRPARATPKFLDEFKNEDAGDDDLRNATVQLPRPPIYSKPKRKAEGEEAPPARKQVKTCRRRGGFSYIKRLFSSSSSAHSHRFAERMLRFRAKMDNYLASDLQNLDLEKAILRHTRENMLEK